MEERPEPLLPAVAAVIIDVPAARFEATVAFWAGALSATPEPIPDLPGGGTYVHLADALAATVVLVQRIGEGDRPRFHLDVAVADRDAAVQQAVANGGHVIQREDDWTVVADPADHPLCLGFEDADPPRTGAPRPDRGYLDAVFLDVPPDRAVAELAFWSTVLDAPPEPRDPTEAAYLPLTGVRAADGAPIAVDVQATPHDPERDGVAASPRVHVDLSAVDVDAEVTRLTDLGARYVAAIEYWVTLADPAGNLFCVVPRPTDQEDRT